MKTISNTLLSYLIRDITISTKKITGSSVSDLELKRRLNKHINKLKSIKQNDSKLL